ncbi:MAG: hypothetical protein EP335_05195 [Alphaproteobacteria bacterium]|nr:MAG: hypothetical protein EP335_05195 [Alphaproteobacteria bacterium]
MKKLPILIAALAVTTVTASANAYVGPGAGLSLLGALWALLLALITAIGFIAAWPVRKFLRRRKAKQAAARQANGAQPRQG